MSSSTKTCSITRTKCRLTRNDLKEIYAEDFTNQMSQGLNKSSVSNLVG